MPMTSRDEFIATLAHELRGPLAPLRTAIDLAKTRRPDDPLVVSALNIADRQIQRLVRLVDDLLDIGRIASGQLDMRREPVALREVIVRSIEATRPMLEEHRHHILSDVESSTVEVLGDKDRLVQVFSNLLSNAAKYTPDGGHVAVTLVVEGDEAIVHVQDTGIGLASDELDRVFDLFTRVRDTQHMPVDGLGVGLALARHIVHEHHGTITVASKGAMRGACFSVHLPLHDALRYERTVPRTRAAAVERRRVLVVDDNVDSTATLALLLEALGHDAVVANDGKTAIRLAQEIIPDLMLLDLGLPDIDGLEVVRLLRAIPNCASIYIVALTGWGQPADREQTRAAGFDLHFVKPLSRDALMTLVDKLGPQSRAMVPPALPPS